MTLKQALKKSKRVRRLPWKSSVMKVKTRWIDVECQEFSELTSWDRRAADWVPTKGFCPWCCDEIFKNHSCKEKPESEK